MKIIKLFLVLYKIKVLSPIGLLRLTSAIYRCGFNLMTLLSFAEKTYGDKVALVDEHETLSYKQLLFQSEKLSVVLFEKYQLKKGQKVGLVCKNHASLVLSIFAFSRLGANIYLLNPEMSKSQFEPILDEHDFDLLVYDVELSSKVEKSKAKIMSYHTHFPAINNLLTASVNEDFKLQRNSMSKLVLLTGGTTGKSKEVVHKPSFFHYLDPFLGLLSSLKLLNYQNVYIATPIYHGYGIAVLFLFVALGKKVVITKRFNAEKACHLIREQKVEVVTVVPIMLSKMLRTNVQDLKSLSCIASGSSELNPKLVKEVFTQLGDILYNLYGTSESGLNVIAIPQDLKHSGNTIGKVIKGVPLKILDNNKNEVGLGEIGQFCIQKDRLFRKNSWVETGDLGYQDANGYYFLCGRTDDMVVSAGVNVYPIELEQVLIHHPQVEEVAVIGISDEEFGQRLKAFVKLTENTTLTKEELHEWLRPRVARFQVPKDIVFVQLMPYTPIGKLDKKQLKLLG